MSCSHGHTWVVVRKTKFTRRTVTIVEMCTRCFKRRAHTEDAP